MKTSESLKGIAFILLGVFLYSLYGIYSRLISELFGPFSQNYVREIILFLLFLALFGLKVAPPWQKIKISDRKWFTLWILSGSSVMIFMYLAFNLIPIGTAYFISYASMTLAGFVCGKILFKDKLNPAKLVSIGLIGIGLYTMYSVKVSSETLLFSSYALFGGLLTGLWNVTSKKISSKYHITQLMLLMTSATAVVAILGAVVFHEPLPKLVINSSWLWIVAYALTELLATISIILGFKRLEAQRASAIMPIEALFATFFSWIIFGEVLAKNSLIGGILILIAVILPNLAFFNRKSLGT